MRAVDLNLTSLLEFTTEGGLIRFAGQRAVVFDAVAIGLLRRQLTDLLGQHAARGVLTRFGYGYGWRTAETMRDALPWSDPREWRIAGGRLHRLQGLVRFEPIAPEPSNNGAIHPFAEGIWHDSYECEQHLLHQGQADEPVCWSLAGYASGYLSYAFGEKIYCVETECRGRGDAVCRMVGRTVADWGETIEPHLPFYEHDCLDLSLRQVRDALTAAEQLLRQRRGNLGALNGDFDPSLGLVARSDAMRRIVDMARRLAAAGAAVLITGESGSGKERLARILHERSPRAAGPFVAINCAAVPSELLEIELFGHARGASGGATTERVGRFEAAHGGTLLLDEIGDVSPGMQAKLLRVLQEREVRRIGDNHDRPIDVRVVAAMNRDLATDVSEGRFCEELFHRLRVVEMKVPALRERPDDILPLARHLLAEASARLDRRFAGFSPDAAEALLRHMWPGNVRDLQNAMEHAAALGSGRRIEAHDLPDDVLVARPESPREALFHAPDGRTLAEIERDYILTTLKAAGGNKAEAARRLDIGVATLFRKLKRYRDGHL